MKYKFPLYFSFASSAIALILLYLNYSVFCQTFLVIAFLMSFGAFKLRGVLISAVAHVIPAWTLAWFYFNPGAFPFLSCALVLTSLQNIFLEMVFPGRLYNNASYKLTVVALAIVCYFIANIFYPSGIQAWIFPGLMILMATMLTAIIVKDVYVLEKINSKGCISAGSACPPFNLPDEEGKLVSNEDFKGNYLLMVFVRGDWCPGCHIMLRCYERNREKFAERGVHLLSIGPDPLGINKNMVQKLGLNYHVLSDEKQMLARQFCVELQEVASGGPQYDFIPLPASFLLDKQGIVRYTSRADKAGEILHPDQIFQVLDSLK
jgi:peroxiredoxin